MSLQSSTAFVSFNNASLRICDLSSFSSGYVMAWRYSPQQLGSALSILKSQRITALKLQNTTVKRRNNNNNKKPTLFSDQDIILLQAEVDKGI